MNKEEYFQFYMNERCWKIYIKSQQEIKDYYNEESLCDISANAYKIISSIITDFIDAINRKE